MRICDLCSFLDETLQCADFKDVSYNGLQVQGREEVKFIVTAADASLSSIEAAAEQGADALLVHHGLFWRGADPRAVGSMQQRLKTALEAGLNILAYHLPVDAHPQLGNNAYLCRLLGARSFDYVRPGDKTSIAMVCELDVPLTAGSICVLLGSALDTDVELLGSTDPERPLRRIAVCSGSGASVLESALLPDFEALLTGDVHEQTYALARELNVAVFAAGHHATEQDGVRLLGEYLASHCGLKHQHLHFAQERSSYKYTLKDDAE